MSKQIISIYLDITKGVQRTCRHCRHLHFSEQESSDVTNKMNDGSAALSVCNAASVNVNYPPVFLSQAYSDGPPVSLFVSLQGAEKNIFLMITQ